MQTNWTTLLIALLGALKLILQPFGIEISDEHINAIVNGAAAVVTVGGVIYHHMKKPKGEVINAGTSNTIGSNK